MFNKFLAHPRFYGLKSTIISMGRNSVKRYIREQAMTGRVLDVGCGPGRHASVIPGEYWGIDTSEAYIAHAKKTQSGNFQVMDATQLAFPEDHFDAVYCASFFHHLADDQVLASIREMKRVLKPGGAFLVIDGVYPPRWNLLGTWLFNHDRGGHMRTLTEMTALMNEAGLQLVVANLPGSFPYHRAVFK